MTECISQQVFSFYSQRKVRVDFCGGQISSDTGLLTLRAFDERHHFTAELAQAVEDRRDPQRADHSLLALLRQRLYAICAGYEDANDAQRLRHDPILQMVADKPLREELGSQPTLSRLENGVNGRDIARLTRQGLEWFVRVGALVVDLTDEASQKAGIEWWEEFTGRGGEGMVVKPIDFVAKGRRGLSQPAVKCRGREYLRIIYGPEYCLDENLERLRSRGLGTKRSLALREFALGIEALERFVRKEPLRRVHECVFGVLALESEPVDPRL